MLLRELEPGIAFKLLPKTIADEKKRLSNCYAPSSPIMIRLGVGTFELLMPQTNHGLEVSALEGGWFGPSWNREYEIEVVSRPYLANPNAKIPSRSWLMTSCDPEVFLEKDGKIVPGFAVLPKKKSPRKVDGGVFHEDGFQAEFSPIPRMCHEEVIARMGDTMKAMLNYGKAYDTFGMTIGPGLLDKGVRISDATFVELEPELLNSGTDAQVALGCEPSENIWGHTWFTSDQPRKFPYRMAGGHIHLGRPQDADWFHKRAERIIKAMDIFCGVPSVALLAGLEDPRRRQYYGRAGEFRFQKHGLEYRTLSNAWLQNPPLAHLMLNLARGAFRIGTSNWEPEFKYDPDLIRHIINDHDVPAAQAFVAENAKILIWMLDQDGGFNWGAKALTTIHNGARAIFKNSLGIHRNWIEKDVRVGDRFEKFLANHSVSSWPGEKKEKKKAPKRRFIRLEGLDSPPDPSPPLPAARPRPTLDSLIAENAARDVLDRSYADSQLDISPIYTSPSLHFR